VDSRRSHRSETVCRMKPTAGQQQALEIPAKQTLTMRRPYPAMIARAAGPGTLPVSPRVTRLQRSYIREPPYCRIGAGAAVVTVVSRGSDGLACNGPVDGWYHAAPYWLSHTAQEEWRPSACSS
jgi:hypothetical protein